MEPLLFHRSLYRPDAVRAVLHRFSHLCRFEVEDLEHGTRVILQEVPERLQARLPWEIANHVLFQSVSDDRSGS